MSQVIKNRLFNQVHSDKEPAITEMSQSQVEPEATKS